MDKWFDSASIAGMDIAQNIIYLFDLFGTIIFAITGAVKRVRCKWDFLGVIV